MAYAAPVGREQSWRIEVLDLETRSTAVLTEARNAGGGDRRPRYSPDGAELAFIRTEGVRQTLCLMPAGGGRIRSLDLGERFMVDFDWMPDGRELLVTAEDGLWGMEIQSGRRRLISAGRGLSCVSVAGKSSLAAFTKASGRWGIWEINPRSGDRQPLVDSSRYDGRPALSAAGDRLAFITNRQGHYALWKAGRQGEQPRPLVNAPGAIPDNPEWSPGGDLIAFDMLHQGHSVVAVIPADGGAYRVLTNEGKHEEQPTFSRDGRWIYFRLAEEGQSSIWKRPAGGGQGSLVARAWLARESLDGDSLYLQPRGWDCHRILVQDQMGGEPRVAVDLGQELLVDWRPGVGGLFVCRKNHVDDRQYRVEFHPADGTEPRHLVTIDSRRDPELVHDPATGTFLVALTTLLESDLLGLRGFNSF
jgi:Tol biopolymer transport system component